MERNVHRSPERESLNNQALGRVYDKFAALVLERGQKHTIPESAPLPGYPQPAEYHHQLTKDVMDRALSKWSDHIELTPKGSYVLYTTPHIYDEAEGERCVSSVVDIIINGRYKGTDIDVGTSFRIEINDFSERNMQFHGEFVQTHTRDGHYIAADEAVLTEDGVIFVEPELRRALEKQDLDPIGQLAFQISAS